MRLRTRSALLLSILLFPTAHAVDELAVLEHKRLPEASGLAVSGRVDTRIWFINDSGNKAELIAYDYEADDYEFVRVKGAKNRDWEDLEKFMVDGEPWLAIADVGDNRGKRKKVRIYLLPEPTVLDADAEVYTTVELKYPDRAHDVESLAIDPVTKHLYLLSKRDAEPILYRAKLPALVKGIEFDVEAEELGEVTSIPEPTTQELMLFRRYGKYLDQPTGLAFHDDADAAHIALMTYRGAYLAPLGLDRDWLRALNESLCAVSTPLLAQGESIGVDSTGALYVTSEGKTAPLYRLPAQCTQDIAASGGGGPGD